MNLGPLSPYLTYVKLGAAALALSGAAWAGFHFGGLSAAEDLAVYKTAVEAQRAAQLKTVVDTLEDQIKQAAAQHAADQRIVDAYDAIKDLPPPHAGLVERMQLVEAASCAAVSGEVPGTGDAAGGTHAASGVSRGDPEARRLLQGTFNAGDADAIRWQALIAALKSRGLVAP